MSDSVRELVSSVTLGRCRRQEYDGHLSIHDDRMAEDLVSLVHRLKDRLI